MTPERLEELKAILKKIDTGWNWRATVCEDDGSTLVTMGAIAFMAVDEHSKLSGLGQDDINKLVSDTASFIATSRYAIPELIAEVERLREEIEMHREAMIAMTEPEDVESRKSLDEILQKNFEQRHEIHAAFVAKHGCEPDECEQVMWLLPGSITYFIQPRNQEETP